MSLLFYTDPVSNYCAKVAIALRFKGIAHRSEAPPGGYASAEYRRIVPTGTIPAIVDAGFVLAESETIVEYLEERTPQPPLLPGDLRQRALVRWLARLHDTRGEPPLRALFSHMDPTTRDPAFVDDRLELFRRRLEELAGLGRFAPWMAGGQPSAADFAWPATLQLAALMHAALGRPFVLPPPLAAWYERVREHPAVAAVLAEAHEATVGWLRRKGAIA